MCSTMPQVCKYERIHNYLTGDGGTTTIPFPGGSALTLTLVVENSPVQKC